MKGAGGVTELLERMSNGEPEAKHQVLQLLYDPMRRMAHTILRREWGCSFQPTDLVHQVVVSKLSGKGLKVADEGHFLGLVGHAMKQILIDRGRRRTSRAKHLNHRTVEAGLPAETTLSIRSEMNTLRKTDPRAVQILLDRVEDQLTWEDTAARAGVAVRTARDDYEFAVGWLRHRMKSRR